MLQHIKTHVPDSELTLIKITNQNKNDLKWKDANEFSYHGLMYDVVKTEKSKNQTSYFCIADHREMELLQQLENQIDQNKSTKSSKNSLVKSLIKVIPKVNNEVESTIAHIRLNKNNISTEIFEVYNSLKLELNIPPPKFS